jgi:hypothetical protein
MKRFSDFDNTDDYWAYTKALHLELLGNIKAHLPQLKKLRDKIDTWDSEDLIYRFYHGSFKVYYLQGRTRSIVELISRIKPKECTLDSLFCSTIERGIRLEWDISHNKDWEKWTRPILESYFHARYFLDMMIKYGEELEDDVQLLPSGWAAVLCLYNLR